MNIHNKKELGKLGEDLATKYLQSNGYSILKRNFYCSFGEIDIIAKNGKDIVLVEVKTRLDLNFGSPLDAINYTKRKHIYNSALYFLYKNNFFEDSIRFDAIEVMLKNGRFEVNHVKNIM